MQHLVKWLEENGICVDSLEVGPSNIFNAGRGAFAKCFIKQGDLVVVSPMMRIDRRDLDGRTHKHLVVNYVVGQPNSTYHFYQLRQQEITSIMVSQT